MGRKNEYLCEKIIFVCLTKFKLLRQIKVNSVNGCEFFNGAKFLLGLAIMIIRPGCRKTYLLLCSSSTPS